jgi:two-component system LytT family response regulator
MNILIIEDETAAAVNLKAILKSIDPTFNIITVLESIEEAVEYFEDKTQPTPDLVFMDIHLADGASFRIFDSVGIEIPIIFTTAYDQYAIEAFKVNSIDYLLKPINEESVSRAIDKWQRLTGIERSDYNSRVSDVVKSQRQDMQVFLVHFRDKIIPLHSRDIAFFHTFEERVTAYCYSGEKYKIDLTLEALQGKLSDEDFFRVNRQFIVARTAVKDISVWFGSRLAVNTAIEVPERIIVPKARVHDFKNWLTRN